MPDPTLHDGHPIYDGAGDGAGLDSARHGQAALLLVESLLHALIDKSVVTLREAIEIVDIAADVERDLTDAVGQTNGGNGSGALDGFEALDGEASLSPKSLLAPLARSLRGDVAE